MPRIITRHLTADGDNLSRVVTLLATGLERLIAAKAAPEKTAGDQLDFQGNLSVNTPHDLTTTETEL